MFLVRVVVIIVILEVCSTMTRKAVKASASPSKLRIAAVLKRCNAFNEILKKRIMRKRTVVALQVCRH